MRRIGKLRVFVLAWILLAASVQGVAAHDPLAMPARPDACEIERLLYPASPPLQGPDVEEVQERLRELGYYRGAVDGVYGPLTQAAVAAFQTQHAMQADSIFRTSDWGLLDRDEGPPPAAAAASTSPPDGDIHIVIDTNRFQLQVMVDGEVYKTFPVAVGRPTQFTLTPVGEWRIIYKARGWGGGFGTRFMGLNVPWGIYGIHGTNKPGSIGNRASAGCIRMYNRDVEQLFEWVPVGTRVIILGDPPDVGLGRPMQSGTSGRDVVFVQMRLQEMGFNAQGADGRFGPNTETALRDLQRAYDLPEDGRVYDDIYYLLGLK